MNAASKLKKSETAPKSSGGPGYAYVWRYLLLGLSFANLCFLKIWAPLLTYTRRDMYLMKTGVEPFNIVACILNILLIGSVLAGAAILLQRHMKKWIGSTPRALLFLAALLLPLNAIRAVAVERFPFLRLTVLTMSVGTNGLIAAAFVGGVAAVLMRRWLMRAIPVALLILSCFVPINIVRGLLKASAYDAKDFSDKPLTPRIAQSAGKPRLLWVVFDEWDERLTFLDRSHAIRMPELDRFATVSLHATNAYPPSSQTAWSLPALTTGHLVQNVEPKGPDDLELLLPAPDKPVRWHDAPNIFSEARASGYNVGVVGFYHPYCRIFNDSLSECSWWPTALQYNSNGDTFGETMINQVRSMVETDSRSLVGQALAVGEHGRIQQKSLAAAKALVRDPSLGVVFLHFAVPHPPDAYDRRTGRFDAHYPPDGYWNNLVLLDRFVGELRSTMEAANLWDSTTVLLSADHWNRASVLLDDKIDHRIPFLLKFAGQHQGLAFDHPFNTVLSHDLALAILRGEVTDPRAGADWLERHRTIADSPYSTDFIP